MSLYTKVDGADYMSRGTPGRDAAIAEARAYAQDQLARFTAICEHLAKPDAQLRVTVVRGAITERFVCEIGP